MAKIVHSEIEGKSLNNTYWQEDVEALALEVEQLKAALAEKQDDLSPCTGCGDPVHGVPEGLALCETCAKQGEETA